MTVCSLQAVVLSCDRVNVYYVLQFDSSIFHTSICEIVRLSIYTSKGDYIIQNLDSGLDHELDYGLIMDL